ncbi:hypothetical protein ACGFNP_03520 [Nonomuraea sp. NPDC049269]|uniref:hypothetical protein n=1 Tax=Nonomuraea sp. NPDC049269 TaxID=3364349 RepID=UPI003722169B
MTTEIVMLIVGVLIAECTEIAPWLAKRLVRWSTHLRYADQIRAEVRAEELEAVIDARPGKLFKLITASVFVFQAAMAWAFRRTQHTWSRALHARNQRLATKIRIERQLEMTGDIITLAKRFGGSANGLPGLDDGLAVTIHETEALNCGLSLKAADPAVTRVLVRRAKRNKDQYVVQWVRDSPITSTD